jgi:serine protease Do
LTLLLRLPFRKVKSCSMTNCMPPRTREPSNHWRRLSLRNASGRRSRKLPAKSSFALAALGLAWLIFPLASRAATEPEADVRRDAAVRAVEKVLPSVVNISTETIVEVRDPLEDLFRDFFGPYYRQRPPDAQKSLGSGVLIDEAGYILTNYHVVRRATRITVTLADGREFQARALSRTAKSDVALLKLVTHSHEKFQAIRFAADDDLLLGETVLALGNPFGLGVSVSRGILSSKTRRPPVEGEPMEMADWLQTDAAINPGNSGGPLVNLRGELIGLNVAIYREGQGIGFAIPVKRLSEAVSEIFTPEEIKGLWLGSRFKMEASGVVVASVEAGSPADKAGLRAADVIGRVDGRAARSPVEVNREIINIGASREFPVQVRRQGERRTVMLRLVPEDEVFNASLIRQKLGVTVQAVPRDLAEQLGLNSRAGLLIAAVERNSPAARANLVRGYVIRTINGTAPESVLAAAKIVHRLKRGETAELGLLVSHLRGGFLEIYPAKAGVTVR